MVNVNEDVENRIHHLDIRKSSNQQKMTSSCMKHKGRPIISRSRSVDSMTSQHLLRDEAPLSPAVPPCLSMGVMKSKSDSDMSTRRQVSFSNLHVREYNVVFGDHPCCMSGPPLTLGWNHDSEDVCLSLEDYESSREPRKARKDLRLTCEHRRQILLHDQSERDLQHEERRLFRERQRNRRSCSTQDFFILPSPTEKMELLTVSSRSGIFDTL